MKRTLVISQLIGHTLICAANPCNGIDRSLSNAQREAFAPAIETHLNAQLGPSVQQHISTSPQDVLQVFRLKKWHIVYVNTNVSDEPYLFYADAPNKSSSYTVVWAGAATYDEAPEIRRWLAKEAPGIPRKLASCFAWHVTNHRDM